MRILIAIRSFQPINGGGDNQLFHIAHALVLEGHIVTILTGKNAPTLPDAAEARGVMIRRFREPDLRFVRTLAFLAQLAARMIATRSFYDLVFTCQANETAAVAIALAKLLGKKVTCELVKLHAIPPPSDLGILTPSGK